MQNTSKTYPWQTSTLSDEQQEDLDRRLIAECKFEFDDTKKVLELLEQGANPNAVDDYMESALRHAVRYTKGNIAKALLDGGANVNSADEDGHSILHLLTGSWFIHNSDSADAKEKYLRTVKVILDADGVQLDKTTNNGNTPISLAALQKNLNMVRLLLDRGANFNIRNKYGATVLNYILTNNKGDDISSELIRKGAKLSTADVGWKYFHKELRYAKLLNEFGYLHPNFFGKDDYDPTKNKDIMKQVGDVKIPRLSTLAIDAFSKDSSKGGYKMQDMVIYDEKNKPVNLITAQNLHLVHFTMKDRVDLANITNIKPSQKSKVANFKPISKTDITKLIMKIKLKADISISNRPKRLVRLHYPSRRNRGNSDLDNHLKH